MRSRALAFVVALAAAALARRSLGVRVALHPARHLRRRADQLRQSGQGLSAAEAAEDAADPRQPRLGRGQRRRQAQARQPDEPERPGLRLVGLRPNRLLRAAARDQGRLLGRRDAAVGERGQGRQRGPQERARPRAVRHGCRAPLQRHLPDEGRADPPAGTAVARLERAEQPGLPAAPVQEGQGQGRDPERDRLREDLQRRRQGRAQDHDRRVQGRLRRHRPARQQQPELRPAGRLAARRSCGR